MERVLGRLGRWAGRHPWRVILTWILVAAGVAALSRAVANPYINDVSVPGSDSEAAAQTLAEHFPGAAGASVVVVVADDDLRAGLNRQRVEALLDDLRGTDHVATVGSPLEGHGAVAQDGGTMLVPVTYDRELSELPPDVWDQLLAAIEPTRAAGLEVELSGELAEAYETVETGVTELVGLGIAALVLLVAFGSVVAMLLPVVLAMGSVVVAVLGLGLLTPVIDLPPESQIFAVMIGLAVGVDYSLFIVTRYREGLAQGQAVPEAIGDANATAGHAVTFAGFTVLVALLGLLASGVPALGAFAAGVALAVLVAVPAALTLLPALLGLVGHRIDRLRVPGTARPATAPSGGGRWHRFAEAVGRHPWGWLIGGLAGIALLTAPLSDLRIGEIDARALPPDSTVRQAYELIETGFGPGFIAQLTVVADDTNPEQANTLAVRIGELDGVTAVEQPQMSTDGTAAAFSVIPASAPGDEATAALVASIRDDVVPTVTAGTDAAAHVGGGTALNVDLSERVEQQLPLVIAVVIALSFLLLTLAFRSLLVPLKAAVLNLLSIGAAYGVVVAVFQWGWGLGLIGLDETVPIHALMPMLLFVILFGLSMDYEVFLLSRIRECYLRTDDAPASVAEGIESTARVITSAALIMVSVFGSFVFLDAPIVKMLGLGLAVAVAVDATLVRLTLVPSVMTLLGDTAWWLPRWLDRLLPHLQLDGAATGPGTTQAHRTEHG